MKKKEEFGESVVNKSSTDSDYIRNVENTGNLYIIHYVSTFTNLRLLKMILLL